MTKQKIIVTPFLDGSERKKKEDLVRFEQGPDFIIFSSLSELSEDKVFYPFRG